MSTGESEIELSLESPQQRFLVSRDEVVAAWH
jgi:hypothetical protein